jgi:hypothetical protein
MSSEHAEPGRPASSEPDRHADRADLGGRPASEPDRHADRADLDPLVDRADLDALVRAVDGLCTHGDWDGLLALRAKCWFATGTGRQLWPVASLVEYRLALDAPADWAARVLTLDAGHFALGPLTEVAAAKHPWDELAPHLEPRGVITAFCAHERVVRGDAVGEDDERIDHRVLELPLHLTPWEPRYPTATYRADGAEFPAPAPVTPTPLARATPRPPVDDRPAVDALRSLVEPWCTGSNGRVDAVAVDGDAAAAVAALGAPSIRMAEISPADALAWLAWAGASGGAHGRRRGMAAGRFGAWWALAGVAGLADEWPVAPDELGDAAGELRWFWWDAGEPPSGWQLRLAIADPADGLAWAINATDSA